MGDMIRAIIFDLGGVLFTNATQEFSEYLATTHSLSASAVHELLGDSDIGNAYREGKMTRDEFWKSVRSTLHLSEPIDVLENEWIQRYKLIPGTKDIITTLKKKYPVYFLSDNVKERVEKIDAIYHLLSWFDGGVFSHDIGIRKPNPIIYQITLEKFEVKPEETIFIDDKEKNLVPARAMGIHTILFENPEKLKVSLEELEVL